MMQWIVNFLRTLIGLETSWSVMTLSRVGIDPVTARSLTQVLQPAHTIRLRPEPAEECPAAGDPGLLWHGITDIGLVRDHNEDSFSLLDLGNRALFVVADGMGGHDAGEVASRIAVEAVRRTVRDNAVQHEAPLRTVEQAIQRANFEVRREAARRDSNMGTTLSVAFIADGAAYIGSVGDSRAYWMENGSMTQVTEDHTLVAKLAAAGKLSKEEARNHPRSNLLYRTIGTDDTVKAGLYRVELKKGGTLLLCTDGLWGEVEDEEIRRICTEEPYTEIVCARLVQRANANGGKDNITAVVVKVS
jgi:serine/threonine protein phosphatase PrpC